MVLDSKALLILLRGELNHEQVSRSLEQQCCITTISLACLLAELSGVSPRALIEDLTRLGVEVIAVDSSLTVDAAKLMATVISTEISFAIALACQRDLEVLLTERGLSVPPDWKIKINAIG